MFEGIHLQVYLLLFVTVEYLGVNVPNMYLLKLMPKWGRS